MRPAGTQNDNTSHKTNPANHRYRIFTFTPQAILRFASHPRQPLYCNEQRCRTLCLGVHRRQCKQLGLISKVEQKRKWSGMWRDPTILPIDCLPIAADAQLFRYEEETENTNPRFGFLFTMIFHLYTRNLKWIENTGEMTSSEKGVYFSKVPANISKTDFPKTPIALIRMYTFARYETIFAIRHISLDI